MRDNKDFDKVCEMVTAINEMGETHEARMGMLHTLANMEVHRPIRFTTPMSGNEK